MRDQSKPARAGIFGKLLTSRDDKRYKVKLTFHGPGVREAASLVKDFSPASAQIKARRTLTGGVRISGLATSRGAKGIFDLAHQTSLWASGAQPPPSLREFVAEPMLRVGPARGGHKALFSEEGKQMSESSSGFRLLKNGYWARETKRQGVIKYALVGPDGAEMGGPDGRVYDRIYFNEYTHQIMGVWEPSAGRPRTFFEIDAQTGDDTQVVHNLSY